MYRSAAGFHPGEAPVQKRVSETNETRLLEVWLTKEEWTFLLLQSPPKLVKKLGPWAQKP